MNVLDVNSLNMRNLYPTALGHTVGQAGTSNNQTSMPTQSATVSGGATASPEIENSLQIGGQANPVFGALVFIALIVLLSFAAKRFGSVEEFRNIKASPYNVLIISMAAIIGMPVWKYVFTKFPLPGISTWVASA